MCGICGQWDLNNENSIDRELLINMCHVLRHRGPDDEGIYLNGHIGLGMRRLSIIDLTTGHQPICNEDKSIWIVFNGEIYNYLDLKEFLLKRNHKFYTTSDTEIIVHLYEEFGEDCVTKLNGMFAFAIWDSRNNRLILARDRLGIKPLFYTLQNNRLTFASELKSILQDSSIKKEIELEALHHYLSLNYIPAPLTIFKDIYKIPPAHILSSQNKKVLIKKYWEINFSQQYTEKNESFYSGQLLELLKASVKRRLMSDVPLGALLSGGLDSSTVVALMCEFAPVPIKTFSIGFKERSFNELAHARLIANRFSTDHHELIIEPNIAELLPQLIWYFDEPFADSSSIPVYYVSQLARNHVTVALSGDGGDEIFAGYETYAAYQAAQLYKRLPKPLRAFIPHIINNLPTSDKKVSFEYKAKRFVQGSELSPEEGHYLWKVIFDEVEKKELYTDDLKEKLSYINSYDIFNTYYKQSTDNEVLNRLQFVDTKVYLANDILVKVDKMSMANSLEARVPLLDHQLVEFMASIPVSLRLKNFNKKFILKKSMKEILPWKTLHRKKKGFSIPAAAWLKRELRELMLDILSPTEINTLGFFSNNYIQKIVKEHLDNKKDNSRPIWGLLSFFLWHKMFMNQANYKIQGGILYGNPNSKCQTFESGAL